MAGWGSAKQALKESDARGLLGSALGIHTCDEEQKETGSCRGRDELQCRPTNNVGLAQGSLQPFRAVPGWVTGANLPPGAQVQAAYWELRKGRREERQARGCSDEEDAAGAL